MNKILLSAVAGLAVINAANAGIKETCLQHPDKLVWVEKTERCVPINPCESDDIDIHDAYCVDFGICAPGYTDEVLKLWLGKWSRHEIVDLKHLNSKTVGVKTDDGQYFAYWCISKELPDRCEFEVSDVSFAFSHNSPGKYYTPEDRNSIESGGYSVNNKLYFLVDNESECKEAEALAKSLYNKQYDVKYEDGDEYGKCIFSCDD